MKKDPQDWTPEYLAYCEAHGETDPLAMLRKDSERWPGGKMCGFILWRSRLNRGVFLPGTEIDVAE